MSVFHSMTRTLAALGASCAMLAVPSSAHADDGAPRMAVKRLFAPPADVERGVVRLPDPAATPTRSRVTVITGAFEAGSKGVPNGASVARFRLEHGGGPIRVMPLGREACLWRARIVIDGGVDAAIKGPVVPLCESSGLVGKITERFASQSIFGIEDATRVYDLELPAGGYTLECASTLEIGSPAAVIVSDGTESSMVAHLGSRVLRAGGMVELIVRGETPAHGVAADLGSGGGFLRPVAVDRATVTWSSGKTDVASAIEAQPDGSVRVLFASARAGDAIVHIDGTVQDDAGAWRHRSIDYATRVVDGPLLGREAIIEQSELLGEGWIDCAIAVDRAAPGSVVFAAAELWAGDRLLGWIGGLAEVEQGAAASGIVRLGVARARLALEQGEQLLLRNVRLHERDGFAPLDVRSLLVPDVRASLTAVKHDDAAADGASDLDAVAWAGFPGIATVPVPAISSFVPPIGAHALVLTHGYCANANPWPAAQFGADAWRYEQPNQNLSHDAFAVDIATRAAQFKSYGLIGHSQGGCASLHLYTYYWSGLDWAGPGRLMQCVGAPLEGTALAGNLAALGQVLGIQCGSNYDLTYDGAAAWLSGIPTASRSKLHTYTTTFTNVPFFYDYCSIASDILLSDPEDGVTEDFSGHIVGGVNMGLRTGWCHVSGMRDPAQTGDSSRNTIMNAEGAR